MVCGTDMSEHPLNRFTCSLDCLIAAKRAKTRRKTRRRQQRGSLRFREALEKRRQNKFAHDLRRAEIQGENEERRLERRRFFIQRRLSRDAERARKRNDPDYQAELYRRHLEHQHTPEYKARRYERDNARKLKRRAPIIALRELGWLDGYEIKNPSLPAPVEEIVPAADCDPPPPPPLKRPPSNPNAVAALQRRWQEPEFRAKLVRIHSERMRRNWQEPEYRAKMMARKPRRKRQPEAIHHLLIERLIDLKESGAAIPPELTKALSGVKTKLPEWGRWIRRQRRHRLAGTIEWREQRRRYGQARDERERAVLDALRELGWT
jgi:hypothetical protein